MDGTVLKDILKKRGVSEKILNNKSAMNGINIHIDNMIMSIAQDLNVFQYQDLENLKPTEEQLAIIEAYIDSHGVMSDEKLDKLKPRPHTDCKLYYGFDVDENGNVSMQAFKEGHAIVADGKAIRKYEVQGNDIVMTSNGSKGTIKEVLPKDNSIDFDEI